MKTIVFLLLCCVCCSPKSAGASVQAGVAKDLSGNLAYIVQDLATAEIIVEHNAGQLFVPASLTKLLSVGAALELLGPEHQFKTSLGYQGILHQGILRGDLYILGGGDPSLGSEFFHEEPDSFLQEWLHAIRQEGIKSIEGNIVADASLFDAEAVSPYWLWEDLGNYYAAGVYGLAVYDNMYRLGLSSGQAGSSPRILYVQPDLPLLRISKHLSVKDNNKDSAYFYGAPYAWDRTLYGSMPARQKNFVIKGDIPDPPAYLAYRLQQVLQEAGISVKGSLKTCREDGPACQLFVPATGQRLGANDPQNALASGKSLDSLTRLHVFYTGYSAPLSELIQVINYRSNNLFTEYLLRHLAKAGGKQAPLSAREGLEVVRLFWQEKGLDTEAWQLYDASGLSPLNRLNVRALASVLSYMLLESPRQAVFFNSLPQAGKEGTVAGFGKKLPGTLRLKSGSMNSIQAYAGYWNLKEKTYLLVLFCHRPNHSSALLRQELEQVLETIYHTRLQ